MKKLLPYVLIILLLFCGCQSDKKDTDVYDTYTETAAVTTMTQTTSNKTTTIEKKTTSLAETTTSIETTTSPVNVSSEDPMLWVLWMPEQLDGMLYRNDYESVHTDYGVISEVYNFDSRLTVSFHRIPGVPERRLFDEALNCVGAYAYDVNLYDHSVEDFYAYRMSYLFDENDTVMIGEDIIVPTEEWCYIFHTAAAIDDRQYFDDTVDEWFDNLFFTAAENAFIANKTTHILICPSFSGVASEYGTLYNGDGTFTDAYIFDGNIFVQFGRLKPAAAIDEAYILIPDANEISVESNGLLDGYPMSVVTYTVGSGEDTRECRDMVVLTGDATL